MVLASLQFNSESCEVFEFIEISTWLTFPLVTETSLLSSLETESTESKECFYFLVELAM